MITFEDMRVISGAKSIGQTLKEQADMVMTETWDHDISTRTVYLYDWYHDRNKTQLVNMKPENDPLKIPLSIKYLAYGSQTYSKDAVSFHLQMLPGQTCNVGYYNEFFIDSYASKFPCGLYVDIPDADGIYNRWLVVGGANVNDPQFPTFEILKCDFVFRWMMNGRKVEMPGVLRSQNSYNSGVWLDYKIQSVEDF